MTLVAVLLVLSSLGFANPAEAPSANGDETETSADQTPTATRTHSGPGWRSQWMHGENQPLLEAAAGELDPDNPGDELVVVGEGQRAVLVTGHHDSWDTKVLHNDDWYLYTVEIGDADIRKDGNEVITAGWDDIVTMIWLNGSTWETETLWDANDWVYNLAIGDMDPDRPGNEILVAGEDRSIFMLFIDGGDWKSKRLWTDTDYLDGLWVGDIFPNHPGDEALVAGGSGNITLLAKDGDGAWGTARTSSNTTADGWWAGTAFDFPGNGAPISLTMGNAGGYEGPARTGGIPPVGGGGTRVSGPPISAFVGGVGGILAQAWPDREHPTEMWNVTQVWKDREHIYGVTMADLDPRSDGDEVIAVGWSGNATALTFTPDGEGGTPGDGTWNIETVHDDTALLYGVTAGDFDPWHPGLEAAVTNSDGDLTKVQYDETGLGIFPSRDADSAPAGSNVTFPFTLLSRADFEGDVAFEAPDLPDGLTAEFGSDTVAVEANEALTFTVTVSVASDVAPGSSLAVKVRGTSGQFEAESTVILTVMLPDEPDFTLDVLPPRASPNADFKTFFTVSVGSRGGFGAPVNLTLEGLARGIDGEFTPATVVPPGTATLTITTTANTPLGTHTLTVVGQGGGLVHTAGVTLDVQEVQAQSFTLTASGTSYSLGPNGTVLIEVNVQSLFGYTRNVTLNLTHDMAGITAFLSEGALVPTANVTINVSAGADLLPALGSLTLTASGENGLVKVLEVSFQLMEEGPHFYLEVEPEDGDIRAGEAIEFIVKIVPVLGYFGDVHLELRGFDAEGASHKFYAPNGVNDTYEPGTTVKLNVYTSSSVPPGNYTLKVKGTSEGLTHTEEVPLLVEEAEEKDRTDDQWWIGLIVPVVAFLIILMLAFRLRKLQVRAEKEEKEAERKDRETDGRTEDREGMTREENPGRGKRQ